MKCCVPLCWRPPVTTMVIHHDRGPSINLMCQKHLEQSLRLLATEKIPVTDNR